jgi:predicted DNA-binding transcriptional regulator YafY
LRANRLLSLLLLLQARGRMTAHELAERLEVSERTIYRDLDALSAAGVPIYTERGPGGGCELLHGYQTKLTGLTETEIRALFLLGVSHPLVDLGLSQALEGALLKLSAALPSASRQSAEQVRQRIHLDTSLPSHNGDALPHLQTIQQAVWQDRILSLTYAHGCEQRVEPYGLVSKAGVWYLVGAVAGGMQVLRVSRIRAVQVTEERFCRPEAFDLVAYWEDYNARFMASGPRSNLRKKTDLRGHPARPVYIRNKMRRPRKKRISRRDDQQKKPIILLVNHSQQGSMNGRTQKKAKMIPQFHSRPQRKKTSGLLTSLPKIKKSFIVSFTTIRWQSLRENDHAREHCS